MWRPWTGTRGTKAAPVEGEHRLYAFLTTDANAVVAPVHPKAMPVLLRTAEEIDRWLTAPVEEALDFSARCRTTRSGSSQRERGRTALRRRWSGRVAARTNSRDGAPCRRAIQTPSTTRAPAQPRVIARPTAPNK